MIAVLGIKKDIPLHIREKFSIKNKLRERVLNDLKNELEEVIILSTCNRTEIYFNHSLDKDEVLTKIFNSLGWSKELKKYTFI